MANLSYLFIVNPVAGKNRGSKLIPIIEDYCREKAITFKIVKTEEIGGATAIIKQYIKEYYDIYIAVGGDGTVNEVVNGIVESDKIMGIIPCGTGNDFAKSLGIPKDPLEALSQIINGTPRLIDIGKVNNHWFINIASIGLDAEIADCTNRIKAFFNGAYAYIIAFIKVLFCFKPLEVQFKEGQRVYSKQVMLVAICNGSYYGGGAKIAPNAILSDGYFDVCIVEKMAKLKLLVLFPSVFKGRHEAFKEVKIYRTKSMTIKGKELVKLNLDGEIINIFDATFQLIALKFKIIC